VFNTYISIQRCVSQKQQNLIMFIIVLGQYVSILIESSSGTSKKTDSYFKNTLNILNKDLYLIRAWRWFYKNRNMLP